MKRVFALAALVVLVLYASAVLVFIVQVEQPIAMNTSTARATTQEIARATPAQATATAINGKCTGIVAAKALNIRAGPGVEYTVIGWLARNDPVVLLTQQGRWAELDHGGWINTYYIDVQGVCYAATPTGKR